MVALFMREARILSRLQHPGIVGVLDFAVEAGCHVMALEYVAGYHVGQWSRYLRRTGSTFDPALAIHITCKVLDTLAYVHGRRDESGAPMGIVHRDVTPSNVMVDREGIVRLLDFGIARSDDEATKDASERSIKGKFSYLAPETLDGEVPTARGDLYSCGVMLHALIWGKNALLASTPAETLRRVLAGNLPPLEERHPDIPAGLDTVIAKATARDPKVRYQTGTEMASALRALLHETERALDVRLQQKALEICTADALPRVLNVPALDERDAAWRNYVASTPPPAAVSTPPAPTKKTSPWLMVAAAFLVLCAAAGSAIAYWAGKKESSGPTFIVEQRSTRGDSEGPSAGEPVVLPGNGEQTGVSMMGTNASDSDMNATMAPGAADMQDEGPRGVVRERQLARSFARSVPALRRCFEDHPSEEAPDQIGVRLRVGRNGRVQDATVMPLTLPATLYACLTRVSENARFESQPAPITFQVPVSVRRR